MFSPNQGQILQWEWFSEHFPKVKFSTYILVEVLVLNIKANLIFHLSVHE